MNVKIMSDEELEIYLAELEAERLSIYASLERVA